ncbi:MAG: hypothetical protein QNK85_08090 [Crocinitomicaceae bacterium]
MKSISLVALFFFAACSNKDEQFCQCLKAGEELNEYTQQFFEKTPSAEEQNKGKELKEYKAKVCKEYQMMSGKIMRQKKVECEN